MPKCVTLKAPAKVNLFLNVVGKREDGYHEIETIFQAITLFDTISLQDSANGDIRVECDNPLLPRDARNFAYRAAKAVIDYTQLSRGVVIKIEKKIPVAAGLGGGSSDAATVLIGLNKLWNLGLSRDELLRIARGLGADVPFFIFGGTAVGRGIGDEITPLKTPPLHFVLIAPKFSISTAEVYKDLKFKLTKEVFDIKIVINCLEKRDLSGLSGYFYNILEEVSLKKYPYLSLLKERLMLAGALASLMSGSGPAIFGLASVKDEAYRIKERLRDIDGSLYVVSSLAAEE